MNKTLKRILIGILAVIIIAFAAFGIYVSDYYRADTQAVAVLSSDSVSRDEGSTLALSAADNDVGFIFYPGGKVEYTAYLPLLERLQADGVSCYLVKMPFNLAFFGTNAANDIIAAHPEIKTWYIGGHSLGGAFASSYASKHQDKIAGLVLLGAYIYGDFPAEKSLTVYGSNDLVLDRSKITYTENVHILDGGNHAQFGDYGPQKGDGKATISPQTQWDETAELIEGFIK